MARAESVSLPQGLRCVLAGLTAAEVVDDQQWILALMRKHGVTIVAMLWRMLGCEPDVLDAYQTAVCQLAARGPGAVDRNPAGYFYRTAMNAGIAVLRNRRLHRGSWPAIVEQQTLRDGERARGDALEHALDHRQTLERMRNAISRLPPHLRDVVVLRDLAGLPYRRVAAIQGITTGTARLYRRQAVVRLADLIGQETES